MNELVLYHDFGSAQIDLTSTESCIALRKLSKKSKIIKILLVRRNKLHLKYEIASCWKRATEICSAKLR